ncbi:DUF4411 family protein [Micrococcales bacterium 31B]|nr:DUF4411 family protein [Micrococcales bacterium 31B]
MYVHDSNVLITAKNLYYGFDIVPGFWNWLESDAARSKVCSVQPVRRELTTGGDELAQWAERNPWFLLHPDSTTVATFARVSAWAQSGGFTPAALSTFYDAADFYLVAHCLAHGHTLVTHERLSVNAKKRVLIPNACEALGVKYCDTFEMLRREGAAFGLRDSL